MNKNQNLYFSLLYSTYNAPFILYEFHFHYSSHKNLCLCARGIHKYCTQVLYMFILLNSDSWVSADAMLKSRRSFLALNRSREYPLSPILPRCEEDAHAYSQRISLFVSHTIRILLGATSAE